MVITQSPARMLSESPNSTKGSARPASILSSARSVFASPPSSLASKLSPSCNLTRIERAPATTWLLVTMWPSLSTMKPEPTADIRWSGRIGGMRKSGMLPPKNRSMNSRNDPSGCPKKGLNRGMSWDLPRLAGALPRSVAMLTTAGATRSATSAKLAGAGRACAKPDAAVTIAAASAPGRTTRCRTRLSKRQRGIHCSLSRRFPRPGDSASA